MRKFILQRGCGCECGQTFPALTGSCALGALGVRRSVACLSVEKLFCTSELHTKIWFSQILWTAQTDDALALFFNRFSML